jgi:hypothetical protein
LHFLNMAEKSSTAGGRKPRADAQRNRERILEVAKEAFMSSSLDWQPSAKRLVDILIAGSRPVK